MPDTVVQQRLMQKLSTLIKQEKVVSAGFKIDTNARRLDVLSVVHDDLVRIVLVPVGIWWRPITFLQHRRRLEGYVFWRQVGEVQNGHDSGLHGHHRQESPPDGFFWRQYTEGWK